MKQLKILYLTSKIFRIFTFVIIAMATTLTVQAADVSFNGTTNTDWATATNWSTGTVPTSADVITIDASKSVAIANGTTVTVERMILLAGASLTNSGTLTIAPTGATIGSAFTVSGNCSFVNQGTLTLTSANQTTVSNTITINGATNVFTFNGTNTLVGKTRNIFAVGADASATIGGAGFTVGTFAVPSLSTVFLLDGVNAALTVNSGTAINMFIGLGMKGVSQNSPTSFTNNGVINIQAGSAVTGTTTQGVYLWNSIDNTSSTFTNNGTLSSTGFARPAVFGIGSTATVGQQTFTNNGTATFTSADVAGALAVFINKSYQFTIDNTGTLNLYSGYRAIQLYDNTINQQINNTGTINITKGVIASVATSVATYPGINNNTGGVINFNLGFPNASKTVTEKFVIKNNSGATINGSCTFAASTLVTAAGSTLSPGDIFGGVSGYGIMILTPPTPGTKFPLYGNVSMQIEGKTTAGTDYDRLNCTEIDVTNATMSVTLGVFYSPVANDEIPLIYAATSKTGPLSNTTKPSNWVSVSNSNNESVKYSTTAIIPNFENNQIYFHFTSNGLILNLSDEYYSRVELVDLSGRIIESKIAKGEIMIGKHIKGIYFMRLITNNKVYTTKICL